MKVRAAALVLTGFVAAASSAQALFDPGPLPAPRPFPPGRALAEQALKLAPADMELWLDGRLVETRPGAEGTRLARLPPGEWELYLRAPGCEPDRLRIRVPSAEPAEAKLERRGPALRFAGAGRTGLRPKSVTFTPDGRYVILPLMSGAGADLLDARTLSYAGRLSPPESFGRMEGFVETAIVPGLREIWVSQMHTDRIHVFDLDTLAYKESVRAGGVCPKVVAISPGGLRAYVANWVSQSVTVIDIATRRLVARVPTGTIPRGLAPSPDGAYLYVAGFGNGAILRVRLEKMALDTFYPADGGAKRQLVLDPDRNRLYATDMDRGSVFAFDIPTRTLLAEIPLGPNPNGCALSPDGRLLFACTRGTNGARGYEYPGPDFGELVAIDAETLREVDRRWGGDQPTGIAVSPDGSRVVFTDFLDHRVEAYDILAPAAPRAPAASAAAASAAAPPDKG